ncbi:hypothetical protein E0M25_02175 [Bacillus mycoides]|nr:hypothetical protein [Bacillus mycoides]QWG36049.1 hypothetical protein EXW30_25235 [Bacillus mycoides]QWG47408.1 hypothetical protein EXW31_25470 [Bacillus mycoides]QWH14563.1 hypothetical protein EXW38_25755 [Bacillus mycoides]QWI52039.1 hypothetical protein EXW56_25215 [Bacillus mycoides]
MNTLESSIKNLFFQTKSEKSHIKFCSITALFYYFLLFTKQYTALYATYNLIKKRSCRLQLLFLFISSI